jgi:hypothetical protein
MNILFPPEVACQRQCRFSQLQQFPHDRGKQNERLQRVYGYYLDKKLWDEIVPLFTDDARVEIGGRGVDVQQNALVSHLLRALR